MAEQTPGARVKAFRKQKKWSVRDLGERAHVSHSYISRLERGQAGEKRVELEKIAAALGIPLAAILHENPEALAEALDELKITSDSHIFLENIEKGLPYLDPSLEEHVRDSLRTLDALVQKHGTERRASE